MLTMAYDTDETLKRNRNHSWWKRRTRLEKYGVVLLILAISIIIGLIIGIICSSQRASEKTESTGNKNKDTEHVCFTPECVQAAANVLRNIDLSVNPCDDFYEFACGGFIQETPIPDDQAEVNQFLLLNDQVQRQLRNLLEEEPQKEDLRIFKLAKDLYRTCRNTTAIESNGLMSVQKLFKSVGGWPVLEGQKWNETAFDWQKSTIEFSRVGLNMNNFIGFGITPNPKNSSRYIITLDQADLDLPREKLTAGFDDELITGYYDYMTDLSEYFGVEREIAKREVKSMLEFKIKLANISFAHGKHLERFFSYNPMTLGDLQRRYRNIGWLELFNGVLKRSDSFSFTYADIVNVLVPEYFDAFENLIQETSKRDQANYAFYQAVLSVENCLPDKIRARHQQFKGMFTGTTVMEPKWSECVAVVSQGLGIAVGAMYVRKHFQEEARKNSIEIVSNVREALIEIIETLDWMDDKTKEIAIEKASTVETHIGYPDEFLDDKKLEEYYSDLNFVSSDYLDMMTEISRFRINKHLLAFREVINKTDWRTRISAVTINAGYLAPENSIQLPAATLQGPFFNKDRPQYMNYGGIGSIIGHEITHSFDNTGKKYDKNGNQVNWWANKTAQAFASKSKCFIEQYGNYVVPAVNINLNGELTKDENIADNGGIKEAYLAYDGWAKRNGIEPTLPGLNYTAKQMFWISAAHNWCSKEREESLKNDVEFDVHAPTRYRVLGPFSNNNHFAEDFNCPVGSNMNPKLKCQIW